MAERTDQIVIIGAGIGGLSAAVRLAALGERVQIFEQHSEVGGRLCQVKVDDFCFDMTPSLMTMPHVLRGLFSAAKRRIEDYLDLVPLDLTCRYFYRDGLVLNGWRDHACFVKELTQLNAHDGAALQHFLADARNIYLAIDPFLFKDAKKPLEALFALIFYMFRGHGPDTVMQADRSTTLFSRGRAVFTTLSPGTLSRLVARYFQDEHLRLLFNRYASCNGSSPYQADAIYRILPYLELVDGGWHLRGGISALIRALEKLAIELGTTIRTNTAVRRILVERGVARGVVLASGQVVRAKVVIANSDVVTTYRDLLSSTVRATRHAHHLTTLEPSCSRFTLMLGVKGHYEQLAPQNVFFSSDDKAEFVDLFEEHIPLRDPTISLSVSSRHDETQAPAGHESLVIQVNAPSLTPQCNWQRDALAYREHILDLLTVYPQARLADLRQRIVCETMLTPEDFQRRYGAYAGAVYGPSANMHMALFTRPTNCSPMIRRLYFVGSSTHPGGGIPQVMLSSKIVTDLFLQESF